MSGTSLRTEVVVSVLEALQENHGFKTGNMPAVKHLAFFPPASFKAFSLKLSYLIIKTASWDYSVFPRWEMRLSEAECLAGKWFRIKLGGIPWRPGVNPAAGQVVTDFTYSLVLFWWNLLW